MGVVVGEEGVDGLVAELLPDVGRVLAVIDEGGARANVLGRRGRVVDEARRGELEGAVLPDVVGRLRRDDDLGALGRQGLAGVGDVGDEGLDDGAVGGGARLVAVAVAVGAAVVGGVEGAAVL